MNLEPQYITLVCRLNTLTILRDFLLLKNPSYSGNLNSIPCSRARDYNYERRRLKVHKLAIVHNSTCLLPGSQRPQLQRPRRMQWRRQTSKEDKMPRTLVVRDMHAAFIYQLPISAAVIGRLCCYVLSSLLLRVWRKPQVSGTWYRIPPKQTPSGVRWGGGLGTAHSATLVNISFYRLLWGINHVSSYLSKHLVYWFLIGVSYLNLTQIALRPYTQTPNEPTKLFWPNLLHCDDVSALHAISWASLRVMFGPGIENPQSNCFWRD